MRLHALPTTTGNSIINVKVCEFCATPPSFKGCLHVTLSPPNLSPIYGLVGSPFVVIKNHLCGLQDYTSFPS
ncbi:678_t:CDS:1, partial [Acaulospora colombiana]